MIKTVALSAGLSGLAAASNTAGFLSTIVAMAAGSVSVIAARAVFQAREERRQRRTQAFQELLALTVAALLIVNSLIWQHKLGVFFSVVLGLGTGLSISMILDLLGSWATQLFGKLLGVNPSMPGVGLSDRDEPPSPPQPPIA